jgi:FlaA1/EpsC-like NDP-sugar epimerase
VPGVGIEIVYTGFRPGEKLHEELFYKYEAPLVTESPKILLARHGAINWKRLEQGLRGLEVACKSGDEQQVKQVLYRMVPKVDAEVEFEQVGSRAIAISRSQ